MKAHSSHSTSQNGSSSHDKTVINNVDIQSPLSTKSQLTESDNIPEEVSLHANEIFNFQKVP